MRGGVFLREAAECTTMQWPLLYKKHSKQWAFGIPDLCLFLSSSLKGHEYNNGGWALFKESFVVMLKFMLESWCCSDNWIYFFYFFFFFFFYITFKFNKWIFSSFLCFLFMYLLTFLFIYLYLCAVYLFHLFTFIYLTIIFTFYILSLFL